MGGVESPVGRRSGGTFRVETRQPTAAVNPQPSLLPLPGRLVLRKEHARYYFRKGLARRNGNTLRPLTRHPSRRVTRGAPKDGRKKSVKES